MSDLPVGWIDGKDAIIKGRHISIVIPRPENTCWIRETNKNVNNFVLVPCDDALKMIKENADLKQQFDVYKGVLDGDVVTIKKVLKELRVTEQNYDGLRAKIRQLNENYEDFEIDASLSFMRKYRELFAEELK